MGVQRKREGLCDPKEGKTVFTSSLAFSFLFFLYFSFTRYIFVPHAFLLRLLSFRRSLSPHTFPTESFLRSLSLADKQSFFTYIVGSVLPQKNRNSNSTIIFLSTPQRHTLHIFATSFLHLSHGIRLWF